MIVKLLHFIYIYLKKIVFIFSPYLSNSLRKGSFHSQKKSCYDAPFKNGDCCVITFFDGFTSVYVVKALKSTKDNSFEIHDSYIISKTALSTG